MNSWNAEVFFGALMGAGVELFEIVAIAYALARSGFPREALRGTLVSVVLVGVLAFLLGPQLIFVPLRWLRLLAGLVLVYLGGKWIRKSVLRQAHGKRARWIENPLKGREFESSGDSRRFSYVNFIVMMQGAALETFEAAVIVMTIGLGSKAWFEAVSGAFCSLGVTVTVVLALHGYLVRVPDVLLKLGAGVVLAAFGTFWLGEGIGLEWPLDHFSLLILVVSYAFLSFGAIRWLRWRLTQDAS